MAWETPRPQARHLLEPRARGGHDAHVASWHRVGEAERHARHVRGAAIRAHQEQAAVDRAMLERDLVAEAHVVAEQHHVEPGGERGVRLRGGKPPRHRDQGQVGVGGAARRAGQRARP
jgi:hypothetical protein